MSKYAKALQQQIFKEIRRYKYAESDYEKTYIKSVIYRTMKLLEQTDSKQFKLRY